MAGTRIINTSIIRNSLSWSTLKKEIQTAKSDTVIMLSPAQGFTDGSQIITTRDSDSVSATSANLSLLDLTNTTSTSFTVGGDYSTANASSNVYNLYLQGEYDGGSSTVSLVHADGDLHLHLTANTGAAETYTVETDIRTADTVYSENVLLDEKGLPVYASVAIGDSTVFSGNTTLKTNTCLAGDLKLSADMTLQGHLLTEKTTLVTEITALEAGSVLKAGTILSAEDVKYFAEKGFSFTGEELSGGRKILLADFTAESSLNLHAGTVLEKGCTLLSDSVILKDTVIEEDLAVTSDCTVYEGSVVNGKTLTEKTVLSKGTVVKAGSTLRTEASIGIMLSAETTLLAGSVLVKGQLLPGGEEVEDDAYILRSDTVFKAGSVLLDGTTLADGTVLKKGTVLEKGTVLPENSVITAGTVTTEDKKLGAEVTLANNWILSADVTFADGLTLEASVTTGNDMVLAGAMQLVSDTVLGGNTTLSKALMLKADTRLGDNTIVGNSSVTLMSDTLLGGTMTLADPTVITKTMTLAANVTLGGTTTLGGILKLVEDTTLGGSVTLAGDLKIVKDTLIKAGSVVDGKVLTVDTLYATDSVIAAGSTIAAGTVLAGKSELAAGTRMQGGTVLVSGTEIAGNTKLGNGTVLDAKNVLPGGVILHSGTVIGGNTVLAEGTQLSAGTVLGEGTVLKSGTVLREGTVLGSGTVLAKGTVLADGQILSAGTELEQGNVLPEGIQISAGTVIAEGVLLNDSLNLTKDLPLINPIKLGDEMTLQGSVTLANALVAGESITLARGGELELLEDMTLTGNTKVPDQGLYFGKEGELKVTGALIKDCTLVSAVTLKGTTTLSADTKILAGSVLGETYLAGSFALKSDAVFTGRDTNCSVLAAGTQMKKGSTLVKGTVLAAGTVIGNNDGEAAEGTVFASGTTLASGTILAKGTVLGDDTTLSSGTVLAAGTSLGDGTTLVKNTVLGEGTILGAGTTLASGTTLAAGTVFSAGTVLSKGIVFTSGVTLKDGSVLNSGYKLTSDAELSSGAVLGKGIKLSGDLKLTDGAVLGAGIVLAKGTTVGNGTTAGAGVVFTTGMILHAGTILAAGTKVAKGQNINGTVYSSDTELELAVLLADDTELTGNITSAEGTILAGDTVFTATQTLGGDLALKGSTVTVASGTTLSGDITLGSSDKYTVAAGTLSGNLSLGKWDEYAIASGTTTTAQITFGNETFYITGNKEKLNADVTAGSNGVTGSIVLGGDTKLAANTEFKNGTVLGTGTTLKASTSFTEGTCLGGNTELKSDTILKGVTVIGIGSVLGGRTTLVGDTVLGDEVTLNGSLTCLYGTTLKAGSVIGAGTFFGSDTVFEDDYEFGAGTILGENTVLASGTELHKGTVLNEGSVIGQGNEFHMGLILVNGAVVGAGNNSCMGLTLVSDTVTSGTMELGGSMELRAGTELAEGSTLSELKLSKKDYTTTCIMTLCGNTKLLKGSVLKAGTIIKGGQTLILKTEDGTEEELFDMDWPLTDDITLGEDCYILDGTRVAEGSVFVKNSVIGSESVLNGTLVVYSDLQGLYLNAGAKLANGTVLAKNTVLAEGTVIGEGTVLDENTLIPEGTLLKQGTVLPDKTVLPAETLIVSGSELAEGTVIGKGTVVPAGTIIPAGTEIPENTVIVSATILRGTSEIEREVILSGGGALRASAVGNSEGGIILKGTNVFYGNITLNEQLELPGDGKLTVGKSLILGKGGTDGRFTLTGAVDLKSEVVLGRSGLKVENEDGWELKADVIVSGGSRIGSDMTVAGDGILIGAKSVKLTATYDKDENPDSVAIILGGGLELESTQYIDPGSFKGEKNGDPTVNEIYNKNTSSTKIFDKIVVGDKGLTVGKAGISGGNWTANVSNNEACCIKANSEVYGYGYWYEQVPVYDDKGKITGYTIVTKSEALQSSSADQYYARVSLTDNAKGTRSSVLKSGSYISNVTLGGDQQVTEGCKLYGADFEADSELKAGLVLGEGILIPEDSVLKKGVTFSDGTTIYSGNTLSYESELFEGTVINSGNKFVKDIAISSGTVFGKGTVFHANSTLPVETEIVSDEDSGTTLYAGSGDGCAIGATTEIPSGTELGVGTVLGKGVSFSDAAAAVLVGFRENSNTFVLTANNEYADNDEYDVTLAYAAKIVRSNTILKAGTTLAAGTVLVEITGGERILESSWTLSRDNIAPAGSVLAAGTVLAKGTLTGDDVILTGITTVSEGTSLTSGTTIKNSTDPQDENILFGLNATKDTSQTVEGKVIPRFISSSSVTHYSALEQSDVAGIRSEKALYADGSLTGTLDVKNKEFINIGYITVNSSGVYYGIDTVSNADITAVGLEGTDITVEQNQYMNLNQLTGSATANKEASICRWFGHQVSASIDYGYLTNADIHSAGFQTGTVTLTDKAWTTEGTLTLKDGVWAGKINSLTGGLTVSTTYKDVVPTGSDSVTDSNAYWARLADDNISAYGVCAGTAVIANLDDAQDGTDGEVEISTTTQYVKLVSEGTGVVVTVGHSYAEILDTTVSSVGFNVKDLTLENVTESFDIAADLNNITYEVLVKDGANRHVVFKDNQAYAAGITAETLTLGSFRGNITSTVKDVEKAVDYYNWSGNTGDNIANTFTDSTGAASITGSMVTAYGIKASTITASSVLGGTITCDMANVSSKYYKIDSDNYEIEKREVWANSKGSAKSQYAAMIGIQSDTSIAITGRIDTDITLTNHINTDENFNTLFGANIIFGIWSKGTLQSTAVSSTITIDAQNADAAAISVTNEFVVTDVDNTKQSGYDLFDFNGSINISGWGSSRYGIMSERAMNLRVSGTIDVGTSGVAIQTQEAYTSPVEHARIVTAYSDRIEFSDTARIVGDIGLTFGSDNIVMYSGAKIEGTLTNNNGNQLNLEFILTENNHSGGIYHSTASYAGKAGDVTLYSVTDLSVNINNMLSGTEYVLMEYDFDVSSYLTYGSSKRFINISYQGQSVQVTVPTGKGLQYGVKAEFGNDASATVYLSADGKSLRIVSDTVNNSAEYSDARLYTGNGNRILYYSKELGHTYEEYVDYHKNSIIYNQDEERLRLCWSSEKLGDLFGNANGTLQDYYYEVEYRFYHLAADGVTKEYAGESITEKVNKREDGKLTAAEFLTLTGIENGLGVEWRVRAVSADSSKTTAWSSENEYTGKAANGWEQVEIDITSDPVAADVSNLKTDVSNGADPDGGALDASLVRLSWSGAEAGTYAIDHYTVEYFCSKGELTAEEQADFWKYQDLERLERIAADKTYLNGVWSKDTTSQELYLTNTDNAKYIYWRVSAVDTAKVAVRSDYVYGGYFANYPNDKTPPYFVSPGDTEVHGKDSTHEQIWISYTPDASLTELLTDSNVAFAYYLDYCNGTPVQDSDYSSMKSGSADVALTQDDLKIWNGDKTSFEYRYDEDGNLVFEKAVPVNSTDTKVRTHAMMGVEYYYNPGSTFSVDFFWTGADDTQSGVRSYVLQYKASGSSTWNEITISSSDVDDATGLYTYHTDGFADGSAYTFRVYAIDRNGNSMVVNGEGTWNNETGFTFGDKVAPDFNDRNISISKYTAVSPASAEDLGSYNISLAFSAAEDNLTQDSQYASSNGIEKYLISCKNDTDTVTLEYAYTRNSLGIWGFNLWDKDSDGNDVVLDTAEFVKGEDNETMLEVHLNGFNKGEYTVTVEAVDFAGNKSTDTLNYSFGDTIAPRFKEATLTDEDGKPVRITAERGALKDDEVDKDGRLVSYTAVVTWSPADDAYTTKKTVTQDNGVSYYLLQYKVTGASKWIDYEGSKQAHNGMEQYSVIVQGLTESSYDFRVIACDNLGNCDKDLPTTVKISELDSSGKGAEYSTSVSTSLKGLYTPEWIDKTTTVTTENSDDVYTANITFTGIDQTGDSGKETRLYTQYVVTITYTDAAGEQKKQERTYRYNSEKDFYYTASDEGDYSDKTTSGTKVIKGDTYSTYTIHIEGLTNLEYSISIQAYGYGDIQAAGTKPSAKVADTYAPSLVGGTLRVSYDSTERKYTLKWSHATDKVTVSGITYDNGIKGYTVQYREKGASEWLTWDDVCAVGDVSKPQAVLSGLDGDSYEFRVYATDKIGNESLEAGYVLNASYTLDNTVLLQSVNTATAKTNKGENWVEFTGLEAYVQDSEIDYYIFTVGSTTKNVKASEVKDGVYNLKNVNGTGKSYSVQAVSTKGYKSNIVRGTVSSVPTSQEDVKLSGHFGKEEDPLDGFSQTVTHTYRYSLYTSTESGSGIVSSPVEDAQNEVIHRTASFNWSFTPDKESTANYLYALEISDNSSFKASSADNVYISAITDKTNPFKVSDFVGGSGSVYVFTGISDKTFTIGDYSGNASCIFEGMNQFYWRVVVYDKTGTKILSPSNTTAVTLEKFNESDGVFFVSASTDAVTEGYEHELRATINSYTDGEEEKTEKELTIGYSHEVSEYYASYGFIEEDLVITSSAATIAKLKETYEDVLVESTATSIRINLPYSHYSGSISSDERTCKLLAGETYSFQIVSTESNGTEYWSCLKEGLDEEYSLKPEASGTNYLAGKTGTFKNGSTQYSILDGWDGETFSVFGNEKLTLKGDRLVIDKTTVASGAMNANEWDYIRIDIDDVRASGDYAVAVSGNQDFTLNIYMAVKGDDVYTVSQVYGNGGVYHFEKQDDITYYAAVTSSQMGWYTISIESYMKEVDEGITQTESAYAKVIWADADEALSVESTVGGVARPAFGISVDDPDDDDQRALSIGGLCVTGAQTWECTVRSKINGEVIISPAEYPCPAEQQEYPKTDEDPGTDQVKMPRVWTCEWDDVTDVFYSRTAYKVDYPKVGDCYERDYWTAEYQAQNMVTGRVADITGKNKITDIFTGSNDACILVLTNDHGTGDGNGDALFLDDIYSALPEDLEQQARFTLIDTVIAGAGDDLIDLTSDRYAGEGMTVLGGEGNDIIWGSTVNDIISGGSGNDTLAGDGGDDIFCFGDTFGIDTVEQTASGSVVLWFKSGSAGNWNAGTRTYTDGDNKVTVSGVTSDKVVLRFGGTDEKYAEKYNELSVLGAFD